MYHSDHYPPHFHAAYAGKGVEVEMDAAWTFREGRLPPRVSRRVREWAELHRDELQLNWKLARNSQALRKVAPLR